MKPRMCLMLFIALMAVVSIVSAQPSCTNVLISMAPCLGYITQNTSTPSQQCCSQLAHVVRYSSECLCQVLDGGGSQLGIKVNETQALALPKACHVETPPASRCNSGSSVNSHTGSSNTSEHGNGSKTVPGEKSSSNGSIKFSFPLLAILFTASYIIIFAKY
ncbi:Bifunctional inhibitor/plant lipid transfer protein/seed storage helical domain superfamily [Arabidopsis suecica]|uniref:Bifunctional inhibitor/plant lipid transfer protein/seed storage helical domain superfamily n=1 Tax=Arabidopsis suecica TaxID=45249 RepID=A0A8T1YMQ7_ARASU|nr:Bifunctional inhibitor/plant lipid transfer protein/seed storage helical domain superfamily [Arabidopsis suecica]